MVPNVVQIGFGILVVFVLFAYAFIFRQVRAYVYFRRFLLLWLFVTGMLGMRKFFENFEDMPPRVPVFIILFILSLFVFMHFILKENGLPKVQQKYLVLFQVFRLPVEVLLAILAQNALLPAELTMHGRNFDIITGVTAIGMFFYVYIQGEEKSRQALIVWNIMGLILVSGVVLQGLFSTPFIMGAFPVTWLPVFLVPTAYFFHIVSLYKCFKSPENN